MELSNITLKPEKHNIQENYRVTEVRSALSKMGFNSFGCKYNNKYGWSVTAKMNRLELELWVNRSNFKIKNDRASICSKGQHNLLIAVKCLYNFRECKW